MDVVTLDNLMFAIQAHVKSCIDTINLHDASGVSNISTMRNSLTVTAMDSPLDSPLFVVCLH